MSGKFNFNFISLVKLESLVIVQKIFKSKLFNCVVLFYTSIITRYRNLCRYRMDANGENTGKRWRKAIRVHELIIVARWLSVVPFENKYV